MSDGLSLTRLSFGYELTPVLRRVSLEVSAGELCAVIGQSGAGKTTLLKCLLQIEPPTEGEVSYAGVTLSHPASGDVKTTDINRRLGYVPQSSLLLPHLTALGNVLLPLTEVHGLTRGDAEDRALDVMDRLGVADLAGQYPWRLSGGQQQRMAIARTIAPEPQILLMDEPTSAIDAENARRIGSVLREDVRRRSACGLIATHNLAFAIRCCDRVALLKDGRIEWHRPANEVVLEDTILELG